MDRIEQYRVFVEVARLGSFVQAARVLKLPRTSISAAIQRLEASVGTRLLHRTTRKVSLTSDGAQLLVRAQRLLLEFDDMEQRFQPNPAHLAGRLNIDVPSRIARRLLVPALPGFMRQHPDLQLGLGSTDRSIDPVEEGIDCVIRFGTPAISSLVLKPLGQAVLVNCASPAYLTEFGVPEHPDDLRHGHFSVGYAPAIDGREQPWEYVLDGIERALELPSRIIVNNVENYIGGGCAGLGLIQVPLFDVQHLLDSGELMEVMAAYRAAPMSVSILYPNRRQRSPRLGVFIDWFAELIKPYLVN